MRRKPKRKKKKYSNRLRHEGMRLWQLPMGRWLETAGLLHKAKWRRQELTGRRRDGRKLWNDDIKCTNNETKGWNDRYEALERWHEAMLVVPLFHRIILSSQCLVPAYQRSEPSSHRFITLCHRHLSSLYGLATSPVVCGIATALSNIVSLMIS